MKKDSSQSTFTRRQFLATTAATATLASQPITLYAKDKEAPPLDKYETKFFTADEWAFIMAATLRLIPEEGDGPSAHDARVPVFIDQQLAGSFGKGEDWFMEGPHDPSADPARGYQTPLSPAELYQETIQAFNEWCQNEYNQPFSELKAEQQDEALKKLQEGEAKQMPEHKEFFNLLLANTKEGYFADPKYGGNYQMKAWSYIGFPGARASYKEWADQHNKEYPLGPVSISGERA